MFGFSGFDSVADSDGPAPPIVRRFHPRSSFRRVRPHRQYWYPVCTDQARKLLGCNEREEVDVSAVDVVAI